MPPLVVLKLFSSTKAWWTYIDALIVCALWIGAFNADSVSEVTCARIAFVLHSGFIHGCKHFNVVLDVGSSENTHSELPREGAGSYDESQS